MIKKIYSYYIFHFCFKNIALSEDKSAVEFDELLILFFLFVCIMQFLEQSSVFISGYDGLENGNGRDLRDVCIWIQERRSIRARRRWEADRSSHS